jgi:type VI secretion system protein ImpC
MMAESSRAGIGVDFTFGKGKKPASKSGTKFSMLVLGDFGGHATRGEERPGSELRQQRVDLDSFPALMRKIAPCIQVHIGDQPPFPIAIEDLDGFHPDHLFAHLDFFAPMRELRRQLEDPAAFARAAAILGKASEAAPASAGMAPQGDDFQRLLGGAMGAASVRPSSALNDLIREAVTPHIVGKADPRQAELIAAVDGMTGELMRAVLQDPGFQRVEAAWRGLDRMIRALELDDSLQVFVLDASREELTLDFMAAPNLADSAMYRIVVDHADDKPWSLLADITPCSRRQEDAAILARLGTLAQEVEAAVVVGMNAAAWSAPFGLPQDERAWMALRNSPTATSIAIAASGVLLRLPYGKATDPTESFVFNEQSSPPSAERFLWGSASLIVAQLLAQSFAGAEGWDFSPGDESSVGDLPVYSFKEDGDSAETPCAEVWLPESKIDLLIKEGLMPVVPMRGRGEVHLPRFQSIALPPAGLAGRWRND